MVEIKIEKMAYGGHGLGYYQGKVVFVPRSAPGDTVGIRVIKSKKSYDLAELIEVLSPSAYRTIPPCPYYSSCGGCQLQHILYTEQLKIKTRQVIESLERIGGYQEPPVQEMLSSPQPFGYRNKAAYHCTLTEGPGLIIGFVGWEKDKIIDIDHCLLQTPSSNQILRRLKSILQSFVRAYHQHSPHPSLFRYLVIRHSITTDDLMAILVLDRAEFRGKEDLIKSLEELKGPVTSLLFNINPRLDHSLLGPDYQYLWGERYLKEKIGGLTFLISPDAFFQVNTLQAETLFSLVRNYARLKRDEAMLDIYSGVGTIALSLARDSNEVYGVDISRMATLDAINNAQYNGLKNCSFRTGKAEKILLKLFARGIRPDLAILDPPRSGCHPQVIEGIKRMKINRLLYISCNPTTLARDLKLLRGAGYILESLQPIDMFPQTYHIESLACLTRA